MTINGNNEPNCVVMSFYISKEEILFTTGHNVLTFLLAHGKVCERDCQLPDIVET